MDRWLSQSRCEKGANVPIGTVWQLAKAWYTDPREAGWRPRSKQENQAILESVGLTGDFWRFA